MKISYRAIKEPNSLVRRLRYLSQILRLVEGHPLNKDVLAIKLRDWSSMHAKHLENYRYNTGAAHSSQKTRMTLLAANYLDLADKFGLVSKISDVYQLTRTGRVLLNLLNDHPNEESNLFYLHEDERIFYIYQILQQDADILLSIVNMIQSPENASLKNLQKGFQQAFLNRLKAKISTSSQEYITNQLHDRQIEIMTEWKNPTGYAAYIIPPRLHWLLDLGLLDSNTEKNSFIYQLTDVGQKLIETFPKLKDSSIPDVPDSWFNTDFFSKVCPLIIPDSDFRQWQNIDDKVRQKVCEKYIPAVFNKFQKTNIPKISLTQGVMYLCIRLATELHILTNIGELIEWFQKPRIFKNYKYEARISARENESYLVRRHA